MRQRSERLKRPNAHLYETDGMRRTHLRGHANILKRLLIPVGGSTSVCCSGRSPGSARRAASRPARGGDGGLGDPVDAARRPVGSFRVPCDGSTVVVRPAFSVRVAARGPVRNAPLATGS